MSRQFNPARAARHEALRLRLDALLTQLAAVAKSKPGEAAAPVVLALAGDLLFEAREFRPRGERRGLPGVAPDHAGLAAQLGQALALLDLWTGRHAAGAGGWARSGRPLPPVGEGEDMAEIRNKLALRIERHNQGIFDAGRRAGLAEKTSSDQAVAESYPRSAGAR